ncbi:LCP family protein [Streptomyces sp. NPDC006879]|uniref:LCP family protein n=1 Tax=Streptomyces sp. NPDC006879 TaxID=3364767 RepID=UPI003682A5DE
MYPQQGPYDPYAAPEQQLIGYDAYGQPVYGPVPVQSHDPYQQAAQQPQAGYGYDAYGQPQQAPPPQQGYGQGHPQQEYGQATGSYDAYSPDSYAHQASTGTYPQVPQQTQQQWIPQQQAPEHSGYHPQEEAQPEPAPEPTEAEATGSLPGQRKPTPDYRTEQFSFLEEPDEGAEDVIDWLKFTESRSERREEARRRGRNRVVALIVVLALFVIGGLGYLFLTDRLPGLGGETEGKSATAGGPQKRAMIVVHLHHTKAGGTSTALLVDNATAQQGATVLLPNSLRVTGEDGEVTTLGKSVGEDGLAGTRESLDTLLGTEIGGTWRLDTPYLENLVEMVGGIEVDTDVAVPEDRKAKRPGVPKGEKQTLNGSMAVAYATYRASGEPETKQLDRFGRVMYGVLRKLPDDPKSMTVTIETLAQILDPSLTEKDLGASLAKLAEHAKVGDYRTEALPVEDGALTEAATGGLVKDLLGGAVKNPEPGAAVRVGLKDASGDEKAASHARAALLNGGYTFVDGGKATAAASTRITYADDAQRERAVDVAKTLGLPESAVGKAAGGLNAEVTVVLGQDYEVPR